MNKRTIATVVLLVPAFYFVLFKGIIPAFTTIQSDFPNYYTSGMIARTGVGVERMYDDVWFQEQVYANGIDQLGKFSPFPPPTALPFIPLSYLSPLNALRVVTAVNIILLAIAIWLVAKLFSFSLLESTTFVSLSGWGLANCFRLGQLYVALSLTMLAGFYFLKKRKEILAGSAVGMMIPIKYFPLVMIPELILKRKWKSLAASLLVVSTICALSVSILGWEIHRQFLSGVIGEHLQSNLTQQTPYSASYQSIDSLLRTLFVFEEKLNPHPFVSSPQLYITFKFLLIGLALLVAAVALYSLRKRITETDLSLAVLSLLGLLIAPATATYHFLLLWLPVGILLHHFKTIRVKRLFFASVTLYALIGFLPYSFFRPFDGQGLLTLLAYPRLYLMILLFSIAAIASMRISKN